MNNRKKMVAAIVCGIAMMGLAYLCLHYIMEYNAKHLQPQTECDITTDCNGNEEMEEVEDSLTLDIEMRDAEGCFTHEKPIDLSDIVDCGDNISIVGRDTDAEQAKAKRAPRYITAVVDGKQAHPFLAHAKDYYNGHAIIQDLETALGDWMVGKRDGESPELKNRTLRSISSVNVSILKDMRMRKQALELREGVAHLVKLDEGQREKYTEEVLSKRTEALYMSLDEIIDTKDMADSISWIAVQRKATLTVKSVYDECKSKDETEQMDAALHALNECKDFDEQCALLLLMTRYGEDIIGYDECIMTIAERMMQSGKYSPLLYNVWMVWRSIYQIYNCGMSVYSNIPNEVYNEYRKLCFLSCLHHLNQSPNDKIALTQVVLLATKSNVLRYSESVIGNSVALDYMEYFNI